jgi:hypothetical protein
MPHSAFFRFPSLRRCIGFLLFTLNYVLQFQIYISVLGVRDDVLYLDSKFMSDAISIILFALISSLLLLGAYDSATDKSRSIMQRIGVSLVFILLYFFCFAVTIPAVGQILVG